jgi:hypothetical protein
MAKVQFKTSFLVLVYKFNILYAGWELTDWKPNAGLTDGHIYVCMDKDKS